MIEPVRMVLGGDIEMRTCGKKAVSDGVQFVLNSPAQV